MNTSTRLPTTDDLWAAIRGCQMCQKTKAELQQMVEHHEKIGMFASRVIAEAARQAIAGRLYRKE